ncbi:Peptidase M20 dimerization domain-containing protein [Madurella fahalii]|uniref:Peptidase M20 dimerization domain-containing protein n=1 Tax=Madurella fahalii TaxID=1157608 RepID=A0ABQ0GI37_9PEZI
MKPTAQFLLLCSALCSLSSASLTDSQRPLGASTIPGTDPHQAHPQRDAPSYRQSLLSLHKDLVQIPSISGTERDAAVFLESYLTKYGYTVELQQLPSESRYNVLAFPPSTNTNRDLADRVLITSHIDVVPPYIPYRINDTTVPPSYDFTDPSITPSTLLSGRGSVDAKASVAAQIIAIRELLSSGDIPADQVALLYVVGEEVGGEGMKYFSSVLGNDSIKLKSAVFGEPTENKLACGHKGIAGATLTARGKAGHSGYPWLGKSATEVLIRALERLLRADLGSSERFGNTTVNVGVLQGGVAANVIAKEASAKLSIRVAVGDQATGAAIVQARTREVLAAVDEEAFTLEWVTGYGPVECECAVEGFETMVANYGTDVPHLEGDHVSYLYGPGSILVAHGDDEGLRVGDLEDAVEGYKRLIVHAIKA